MMDVKGLLNSAIRTDKSGIHHALETKYEFTGLKEYPRPQMERESYINLNGEWGYRIMTEYNELRNVGKIMVPFSPESRLSGVEYILKPDEKLEYSTTFEVALEDYDKASAGISRLMLNFGAVDQIATIYINGKETGRHEGGYTSFTVDVTARIKVGTNKLKVVVRDYTDQKMYARGKQSLNPSGMFYTAQSGIWQTVWMEWVPTAHVEAVVALPDIDNDSVDIQIFVNDITAQVVVEFEDKILKDSKIVDITTGRITVRCKLKKYKLWTIDEPNLYYYNVTFGEDKVRCYLGMRQFGIETFSDNIPRLCINHVPVFLNGVLDQGYYPESLMTPPSEEAMIGDIQAMKDLGFNMLRKHCKLEPMRWYYLCDKMGMVVWQDIVNGGEVYDMNVICTMPNIVIGWKQSDDRKLKLLKATGRFSQEAKDLWRQEATEMVKQLKGVVSLGEWTIFNEGWGQFNTFENVEFFKKLDDTRPVDAASGWFRQGSGDIYSEHNYFYKLKIHKTKMPFVLSEYGGYSVKVQKHSYMDGVYGYHPCKDLDAFNKDYRKLMEEVQALIPDGLCAAVFTQLTDIEEEQNGLLTYDRKVCKVR